MKNLYQILGVLDTAEDIVIRAAYKALARNARTSQAMIDKFYAAHLTTDQVRKQLHAFPKAKTASKTK